jgi:hypothetical protein
MRWWRELLALAIALAVTGGLGGVYLYGHVPRIGPRTGVEADWFSPSVMFACGKGLICPNRLEVPGLTDFLEQRTDRFDPKNLPDPVPTWALSPFCEEHRYLLYTVGALWRVTGVSWGALKIFAWAQWMLVALLSYGLFRLAMGRTLSALGAILFLSAPNVLWMSASIRDFSKTPFLFAALLLFGVLLKYALTRRTRLAAAALIGVGLGIGMGFRQDILIAVPLGVLVLVARPAAANGRKWEVGERWEQWEKWGPVRFLTALRQRVCESALARMLSCLAGKIPGFVLERLAPALLLVAGFLVAAWPILAELRVEQGAVSSHTLIQGLSREPEQDLGLSAASYTLLYTPSDPFAHSTVNSYARRIGDREKMDFYLSPAYGRLGKQFFREVAWMFPGDLVARALGAICAEFRTGQQSIEQMRRTLADTYGRDDLMQVLEGLHRPLAHHVAQWGFAYVLLSLALLAWVRPRLAILAALIWMYLGAYPSLLFQFRHSFHLTLLPLWFAGLLAHLLYAGARDVRTDPAFRAQLRKTWYRPLFFVTALVLLAALPLGAARMVQHTHANRLLDQCASAPLEPVTTVSEPLGDKVLLHVAAPLPGLAQTETMPTMEVPYEYLVAEFADGPERFPFRIEYDHDQPATDLSWVEHREYGGTRDGVVRFFFPVYLVSAARATDTGRVPLSLKETPFVRGKFDGLLLPQYAAASFRGLYRVKEPNAFRIMPFLWLPQDRDTFRTFKRLPVEETIRELGIAAKTAWTHDAQTLLTDQAEQLRRRPDAAAPYAWCDWLLRKRLDPTGRTAAWTTLAAQFPDAAWARYYRGSAFENVSNQAEAIEAYHDALSLGLRPEAVCEPGVIFRNIVHGAKIGSVEKYHVLPLAESVCFQPGKRP